jgi:hypothetical protein
MKGIAGITHPMRICLTISPRRAGMFEACIDGRLICISRQPLLDASRLLLAEGLDPDIHLVMRHLGSAEDSLSANIGRAAQLTVEHTAFGKPVLRPYKGSLGIETAPPTAPNDFQVLSDLEAVLASPEARLDMPGRKS